MCQYFLNCTVLYCQKVLRKWLSRALHTGTDLSRHRVIRNACQSLRLSDGGLWEWFIRASNKQDRTARMQKQNTPYTVCLLWSALRLAVFSMRTREIRQTNWKITKQTTQTGNTNQNVRKNGPLQLQGNTELDRQVERSGEPQWRQPVGKFQKTHLRDTGRVCLNVSEVGEE